MMRRTSFLPLVALGAALAASGHASPSSQTAPAKAADTAPAASVKSDIPAALAKEATVTLEAARTSALARAKGGTVRSEELEREHGKLIYSFDIAVPGKTGITEVEVDAKSGKVLDVRHESPAKEKREAAEEKKEKPPGAR